MAEEPAEAASSQIPDRMRTRPDGPGIAAGEEMSPCLRCGWLLPVRLMGCRGGRCPQCGHHYPHGDCSD